MADGTTQSIGRYELIRSIGRGAQGAVYQARDPVLDRLVAVKLLTVTDSSLANTADDGAPLEARIAGKLKHPNIVPIFDAGECDIGPYLVFEFVQGQTLADMLKAEGAFSIEAAVPIMSAILKALQSAHAEEILHLDLSPRNVLIDGDGIARVMDFGLAQYMSAAREPREHATGTLRYMAPEHFRGMPLGPWTDVFALGSTFYELVTDLKAFQGVEILDITTRINAGDVNFGPLGKMLHGEAFATFLSGALEKNAEGRYKNCAAMLEAFELFAKGCGIATADDAGSSHSTTDFLLRRMSRTGDFPSISRTLADINRLTGDHSTASADKLANIILRDFALTGKLLKLVNSAFYGARAAEITKISDAVVFLGVDKVRMTANSLSLFGHMKGDSSELRDSMNKSFLAGLIARHLALRAKLSAAEEAFICGMCQNLGENLVIHYFAEEYQEIKALREEEQLDKPAAARGVLGVAYAELGADVARAWKLPKSIVDAIRGLPPGKPKAPETEPEKMRDFAVFANELCEIFVEHEPEEIEAAIQDLLARYENSVSMEPGFCTRLVGAAYEKLTQYAPIFEINVATSDYCRSVSAWLESEEENVEAASAG